jgi:hypothetical protein
MVGMVLASGCVGAAIGDSLDAAGCSLDDAELPGDVDPHLAWWTI